jgi:MFS family permease
MTVPVTSNLFSQGENFVFVSTVFENILTAVFAIVTGFFADAVGRKRLAIMGFAMLGIGYAALGFFQNTYSWYFYTVVDGIAWGAFYVIFLFTLWGDIAQGHNSEKFYVIGTLPYLFSNFMRLLLGPIMSGIAPTEIFTFASFFLFLAVLPLVYAPETLPETSMKERELKSYYEKAKKVKEKYS